MRRVVEDESVAATLALQKTRVENSAPQRRRPVSAFIGHCTTRSTHFGSALSVRVYRFESTVSRLCLASGVWRASYRVYRSSRVQSMLSRALGRERERTISLPGYDSELKVRRHLTMRLCGSLIMQFVLEFRKINETFLDSIVICWKFDGFEHNF